MTPMFDAERLRSIISGEKPDPKAWAYRLRRREHLQDRSLSIVQKAMWRAALSPEMAVQRLEGVAE